MDFSAVILLPAIAASAVLAFVFLLFMAHYYLTVMESTGVGAREVTWMSEPILDNAWKVAYMGWLVGVWLGPAYLIGRKLTAGIDTMWVKIAIPLLVFWVCYPISQLSSLSATSIWFPLVPDVFARLAQKPKVTLGFYLLSIPVVLLLGIAVKWVFLTKDEWKLLFLGAPLMVIAILLYARLLGRLAFMLRFTRDVFQEKKKRKSMKKPIAEPAPAAEPEGATFTQPSELPPIMTPLDGELTGYAVKFEEDPLPKPRKRLKAESVEAENPAIDSTEDNAIRARTTDAKAADTADAKAAGSGASEAKTRNAEQPAETPGNVDEILPQRRRRRHRERSLERTREWTEEEDEDRKSYDVHEAEAQSKEQVPASVIKPLEEELRLLRRDDVAKRPRVVWSPELLAFLAQQGTIMAIAIASCFCFGSGVMIRIARMFSGSVEGG